jgi:hypothetical protein
VVRHAWRLAHDRAARRSDRLRRRLHLSPDARPQPGAPKLVDSGAVRREGPACRLRCLPDSEASRGFWFTPPESDTDVFVTADAWSNTIADKNKTQGIIGTLQATFVRRSTCSRST